MRKAADKRLTTPALMAAIARPSLTLGGAIGHVSSVLGGLGLVRLRLTRPFCRREWCAWPNAACLTADERPPGRRHDVGVGRARTKDPLVVSRQKAHGSRRGRRGQLLEILT
jgi:hypothetical protein